MVLWQPRAAEMDVRSPNETREKQQGGQNSAVPAWVGFEPQALLLLTAQAHLHEEAAGRRHRPLFSPARTLEGITEGALPQHGSDQNLRHPQHRGQ